MNIEKCTYKCILPFSYLKHYLGLVMDLVVKQIFSGSENRSLALQVKQSYSTEVADKIEDLKCYWWPMVTITLVAE